MRAVVVLACLLVGARATSAQPTDGARVYQRECAPCHGTEGHGDGHQAWLFDPQPADLRALPRDRSAARARILDGNGSLTTGPSASRAAAARTDALVSYLSRLPTVDWPVAERGQALYLDQCESCHGHFGRPPMTNVGGTPPDLTAAPFPGDDRRLADRLRQHARAVIPPASLSDDDVAALAAFVRLLSPGRETWTVLCAGCHGDEGVPPGRKRGPSQPFDRAYFATHDGRAIREKVWHMLGDGGNADAMPHFRRVLSEADASAIVDYVLGLPER